MIAAASLIASGCSTVSYLVQAGRGQFELFNRARPIDEVLKDPRTSPRLKRLLSEIPSIRGFAEAHGLRPTKNYREYVALDRPAVVWVVSASEKLRFKAKEWSFPIVGSFNYLGWFGRDAALKHAEQLRAEGWDADVRGATAYSTLGWFSDPILSTMIPDGDEAMGELVNTVLHESVHATIYIKGQSYFNESLASFSADIMADEYLKQSPGLRKEEEEAYRLGEKAGEDRGEKFKLAYAELSALYASDLAEESKLARKAEILDRLKNSTGMKREPNNATLIQFRTYGVGREELNELYRRCGADWKRFFSALKVVKPQDFSGEQAESWKFLSKVAC